MSVFEYLGIILSIIMGLGVTHVLSGLSKTVHHRRTVTHCWMHVAWAFNVLIYIIIIWWGMFWWSSLQEWSFFQFLLLILYAIVLFLLASLLYPWDLSEDFDFDRHFFDIRPWFFGTLAAAWFVDVPETLLKADSELRDLPAAYIVLVVTCVGTAIVGATWSNRTYHKVLAIAWPVILIGYLAATTLSEIAA